MCHFHTVLNVGQPCSRAPAGGCRRRAIAQRVGRSPNSLAVNSVISGSGSDFARCSTSWRPVPEILSRSRARTRPIQKRRIGFSTTTASAKQRFWPSTSKQRATQPPRRTARSWCCMTRPSSPSSARTTCSFSVRLKRSATPLVCGSATKAKLGAMPQHSKLRTAERLVNLLAMFCILGWRIFWLTMLNRSTRHAASTLAFTPLEIKLLNQLAPIRASPKSRGPASLQSCLTRLNSPALAATSHAPETHRPATLSSGAECHG